MGKDDGIEVRTNETLMTVHEVARLLRLKPSWVYRHADDLGAYRLGKYLRFSKTQVFEKLAQGTCSGNTGGLPTQLPKITPTNDNTSEDQGTNWEQKN
jgi:excisionase family DNA binding protein